MKIKIVADSSSNIFEIKEIDYTSVPLKILAGEKEYVDNKELNVSGMIEDLLVFKDKTSTSCPNAAEWMEAFDDADVVYGFSITSNLSGCYNAAMQAKQMCEEERPGVKIHIFDSLSVGPEVQLLMERTIEHIKEGLNFEETVAKINDYMKHTHLLFSLESLNNLARNGRVSPLVAKAAGLLGIRLVGKASDHGTLEPISKCRGEKKAMQEVFKLMKEHGFAGGAVRISHCFNEGAVALLKEKILEEFPRCDIKELLCTGLCSYYAEKGGLIIGYTDLNA